MIAAMTQTEPIITTFMGASNVKIRFSDRIAPDGLAGGPEPAVVVRDPSRETSTASTSIIGGCRRGRPSGDTPSCRDLSSGSAIGISEFLTRRHTVGCVAAMQTRPYPPPLAGEGRWGSRPTDKREQRLLVGLACNFDCPGARRCKRCGNLGGQA